MANELNFQIPPKGFDSYLDGIIPKDQAVLAGAFSMSMMQVKNIQNVDLKAFAKVAFNNETTFGLPGVNGTDVPVDLQLTQIAQTLTALGSGVYGTFTMSNFFGCMSGLPYPLKDINDGIKELQTDNLAQIYQNLYLIVKWEQATATWDGSSFTYVNRGGGYGRAGAGAPSVTVGGNPATAVIGTDPDDLDNFGKIVSINYSGVAGLVVIAAPPGPDPSISNAAYNAVVQGYIDDANNEIQSIKTSNPSNFKKAQVLDANWNITGIALKHEQRARYIAIPPVPEPYDKWLNTYPIALYSFVDSIPELSQDTTPHMSSQTLERISDLGTVGGQSLVGMMRQERNQVRLGQIGIPLDNNIPDSLPPNLETQLMVNGTLPGAVEGINGYTLPAFPDEIEPIVVYDPNLPGLVNIEETTDGDIEPLLEISITDIPLPDDPAVVVDGILKAPVAPGPIVNPRVPAKLGSPLINPAEENILQPSLIWPQVDNTGIAPKLNLNNTGTTLYPATYDVAGAIDKVVECNCDCWID